MTEPIKYRSADTVVDRRWLKRRIVFWRTATIVVALALIAILALGRDDWPFWRPSADGNHIACISIKGIIDDSPMLETHLRDLAQEERVKAVLVRLNSPGGTFSGGEGLYRALMDLSAEKPTVAVMEGVVTSGAYMAAVATDHIVARAGTITGSVGVIMSVPQVQGLLEKLGIGMETFRSGPLKDQPSRYAEPSEDARTATNELLDDLFQQFLAMVTANRMLDEAALMQVRTGQVFTGRQALKIGLVDALGGDEAARAWLENEHELPHDLPILKREVDATESWWQRMLRRMEGRTRFSGALILDGAWAIWHLH